MHDDCAQQYNLFQNMTVFWNVTVMPVTVRHVLARVGLARSSPPTEQTRDFIAKVLRHYTEVRRQERSIMIKQSHKSGVRL